MRLRSLIPYLEYTVIGMTVVGVGFIRLALGSSNYCWVLSDRADHWGIPTIAVTNALDCYKPAAANHGYQYGGQDSDLV